MEVVALLAILTLLFSQFLWMRFVAERDRQSRSERRELQNRIQRPDVLIVSDPDEGPSDEDLRQAIPDDEQYDQVGQILDPQDNGNGDEPG